MPTLLSYTNGEDLTTLGTILIKSRQKCTSFPPCHKWIL